MPEEGPNLSRCVSDWARELREDLDEIGIESSREQRQNWLEVLREGHSHVRKEELVGGDARVLGQVLAEIVKRMRKRTADIDGTNLLAMAQTEQRRGRQQEALEFVRVVLLPLYSI